MNPGEVMTNHNAPVGRIAMLQARIADLEQELALHKQLAARQQLLAEFSRLAVQSLQYEAILEILAERIVPAVADICLIYLRQSDASLQLALARNADPRFAALLQETAARATLAPESEIWQVFQSGRTILFSQPDPVALNQPPFEDADRAAIEAMGIGSAIMVPLEAHGELIGVLSLGMAGSGRRFEQLDVDFVNDLANRAALAIDNALLLQRLRDELAARERSEAALQHSEATRSILLSSFPDLVFRINRDLVYLDFHTPSPELLFLPPEQFLGRTVHETMPPDVARLTREAITAALAQGSPQRFDYRLELADSERFFDTAVMPGGPDEVLAVIRDVTAQKRLEAALRNSEARFRAIFVSAGVGIALIGRNGRAIESNPALQLMLGYDGQELHEVPVRDLTHPDDHQFNRQLFRDLIAGRRDAFGSETRFIRKDRELIYSRLTVTRIQDEQRLGVMAVAIVEDITAQKNAEDERRRIERRLMETQRLESIGVLAGGIAHDFNNLLMAVIGHAELALLDLSPAEPAHSSVEAMLQSAEQAADLTKQLLAYAGKAQLAHQSLNLNRLIEEVLKSLTISVTRYCTLQTHLAAALPPINADSSQIRQVAMNLVINAAESIGPSGGEVLVSTALETLDAARLALLRFGSECTPGDYVCFRVRDNGHGMDAETLERIFEPFFSTRFAGRGLGLAAVLGIVRSHGGALDVQSAPGQGSFFQIWFPAALMPEPDGTGDGTLPEVALQAASGSILVIDDELQVREVLAGVVRRLGYGAYLVGDGPSGLALVEQGRLHIAGVLLDLTMPAMDGEEVARHIRLLRPDLPIILMSGYELNNRAADGQAGRDTVVLQKPFSIERLREALQQAGVV